MSATRDLIDAIADGNSETVQNAFDQTMSIRIADKLADMRQDIAHSMFKEAKMGRCPECGELLDDCECESQNKETEDSGDEMSEEDEEVDSYLNTLNEAGLKKAYVTAVHSITDPDSDKDPSSTSFKYDQDPSKIIKHARKRYGEKFARDLEGIEQKSHWGRVYGKDKTPAPYAKRDRLSDRKKSKLTSSGKMHKTDTRVLKNKIKDSLRDQLHSEEADSLDEMTNVHPDHLHVSATGKKRNGKALYKVHAVGKNYAHGIKPGEHLDDSELDDFTEMGGKIKHIKK